MDLLTFHLGDREFGVDLGRVLELLNPPPITRVPEMPPALLGLIGLRGDPTGIVDAGLRLEGRPVEVTGRTPVLVLRARVDDMDVPFGLLVEAAGRRVSVDRLLPWSEGQADLLGRDACIGFADLDGRLVLVLDVDRLLVFPPLPAPPPAALARAAAGTVAPSRAAPDRSSQGPADSFAAVVRPASAPPAAPPADPLEGTPRAALAATSVPPSARLSPSDWASPPSSASASASPSPAVAPPPRRPSKAASVQAPPPAPATPSPTSGFLRGVRVAPALPSDRRVSSSASRDAVVGRGLTGSEALGTSPAASGGTEPSPVGAHPRQDAAPLAVHPAPGESSRLARGARPQPDPGAGLPATAYTPPSATAYASPSATAYASPSASAYAPPSMADVTSALPRPSGGRIPVSVWVALAALLLLALVFAFMQSTGQESSPRRLHPSQERREAAPSAPEPSSIVTSGPSLPPPPPAAAVQVAPPEPVAERPAQPVPAPPKPSPPADPIVSASASAREDPVGGTVAPAEPVPSSAPPRKARPIPQAMRVTPDTPSCEIHEVRRGDTLWWISARKLGSPYRWPELFGENREQIVDPDVIEIHDRIRIPGSCAPSPAR